MIIQVDDKHVRLLEADVMTDFRVRADVDGGVVDLDLVLGASQAGRCDADHAWISVGWIRAEATQGSGENAADWASKFERMLEYAGTHGWLSDDGQQVRGHIDRGRTDPAVDHVAPNLGT